MHPPKVIALGGQYYTIKYFDKADTRSKEQIGECVTDLAAIFIERDLPPQREVYALLHEILHALWHERAVFEAMKLVKDGEDPEEYIVATLSGGLTELLDRNPKLLRWLEVKLEGKK